MPEQLTFDLPVRPALGREDFFVSPSNAMAVAALEEWQDWPLRRLVLTGPEGAGKTHLAHVWAALTRARIVPAGALADTGIAALAEAPVVVEDADRLAGNRSAEEPLFHLVNRMAETGQPLLLTAQAAPARWPLALPDLASRLHAAQVAEIAPPDDALLSAVLVKQFRDRQIDVSPALIAYLTRHMPRSFRAAADLVAALDRAALAEGRAVTRPLATAVLDKLGGAP